MRPMFVVVRGVLAEDGCQPLPGDKHAVGALPPDGAHPGFRERVRLRRRPDHRDTCPVNTVSEAAVNFRVAVAQQKPQRVGSLAEIHQQIPRLLGHPRAGGVAGHPDHVDPAGGDLEEAPVYPGVLDELLPSAWHHVEQYANNPIEADHGHLKRRLPPMRGLQTDRTAQVVIAGHAFVQNLRRGHYDLGVDARPLLQVAAAFTELAKAI